MHTRVALLLGVLLLTTSLYFGIRETANGVASRLNTQYSKVLTSACRTAAEKMQYDESTYSVMGSDTIRENVIDAFFNTFLISFEEVTTKETDNESNPSVNRVQLYKNIPVVLMIDINGFYVWYNAFEDGMLTAKISSLTTYSETISGSDIYYVRYFLGNRVQVSLKDDAVIYDGTPEDVYDKLGSPGELSFLADYDSYAEYRNTYIANLVEEQVQYYINNENLERRWSNTNRSDYTFEMPEVSMSDWIEMVEYPSIISFYQGKVINNGNTMINTYAFSGSEFAPVAEYYVTDDGYYHSSSCSDLSDEDKEGRTYTSRRELAADGYEPCTKCKP